VAHSVRMRLRAVTGQRSPPVRLTTATASE
jgi:hypothetical protein